MSVSFSREDIPIRKLASGADLMMPVFRFEGDGDKKVYIQANIHGPEIAGIGAAYDLIRFLSEQEHINGSIIIVPSVNPVGLNTKVNGAQVGYADLNETVVGNFNRIYQLLVTNDAPSSDDVDIPQKISLPEFVEQHKNSDVDTIKIAFVEALGAAIDGRWEHSGRNGMRHGLKLALTIQQLSYDANYLIDLHTAARAIYHLYTFPELQSAARWFDLHHLLLLGDSFNGVLDEAFLLPWLWLAQAFKLAGRDLDFALFDREAYTPELGDSDTLDAETMQQDAGRIINYLRYKAILDGDAIEHSGDYFASKHHHYDRYYAPTGGLLLWHKNPGDSIKVGDLLVTVIQSYALQTSSEARTPVYASEAGILINKTSTHVVHEGMILCSVMTQIQQWSK